MKMKGTEYIKFPSPFGVILFQIEAPHYVADLTSFRPLSGLSYFKSSIVAGTAGASEVSVPFRGYLISNKKEEKQDGSKKVSVPFRGYLISNVGYQAVSLGVYSVSVPFRSYLISNFQFHLSENLLRFRPLSGLSYFKYALRPRPVCLPIHVSVPFRGYLISNRGCQYSC